MTSKYKGQTGNTPQSSLDASTEAKGLPSRLSVGTDNTLAYTPTLPKQSKDMLSGVKVVSEKSRQHATILKVVLSRLEKDGLIRRFKVLSADQTTVKEVQIVFDNSLWDENLELRVLSEGGVKSQKETDTK